MTIGLIARKLGVSTGTLIVWERQGLIHPKRTPGGWRLYSIQDVIKAQKILTEKSMGRGLNKTGKLGE